jgi:chromosome segregation ATPase
LEERDSQQERRLAALEAKQSQLAQLSAELARIEAAQRQLSREIEAMRQEANADVAALRSEVGQLKKAADAAERLAEKAQKQLAAEVEQLKASSEEVKAKETEQERAIAALKAWTGALDSRVVSSFPPLFDEFRPKRFVLLWRGSRDGFGARDFHGRCDGHANTLMLLCDTSGNVFGGFTPLQWELPRSTIVTI